MIYLINAKSEADFSFVSKSALLLEAPDGLSKKMLAALAANQPSFVGFYGENAEILHDHFDTWIVSNDLDVLTAWYVDEPIEDVLFSFFEIHLPINSDSKIGYIIEVGEGNLLEIAKSYKDNRSG